jgi:choline dehydrogenase-like flavoprotein
MSVTAHDSQGEEKFDALIIGSGFGGTMTGLSLARAFKARGKGERVQMLERGTWWTTPVGTVQDKEVRTADFLKAKNQPVQFWSSLNNFRGFIDVFTRCFRRPGNIDGLYQFETLGRRPALGLFGGENDGVSVARACGVGGGSLVYSNITIRPPELIFEDARWHGMSWDETGRDSYYELARSAIGTGVVFALNERAANGKDPNAPRPDRISGKVMDYVPKVSVTLGPAESPRVFKIAPDANLPGDLRKGDAVWLKTNASGEAASAELQGPFKVNAGLSSIIARTATLPAQFTLVREGDPFSPRGVKQIVPHKKNPAPPLGFNAADDPEDALWIDCARVFQTAAGQITADFGAVEHSINDYTAQPSLFQALGRPKNYCERQGRCNVGCLPGARHTLNKQLMTAALGRRKADDTDVDPQYKGIFTVRALCEVDFIEALPPGGCRVHYFQHEPEDSSNRGRKTAKTALADKLILAAGSLGTSEILLRSKQRADGMPQLSDMTGFGFSTNGDYIGFLEGIKEKVTLTRGPVTTSFAHLNMDDTGKSASEPLFHTIEDQGVPPAIASVIGVGVPVMRSLGKGSGPKLFVALAILRVTLHWLFRSIAALFRNSHERQELFMSAEELTGNMMCVVAQGREAALGQFRLGGGGRETSLRVARSDGRAFHEDAVYKDIDASLQKLAGALLPAGVRRKFINPFLQTAAGVFNATSVPTSHPIGGCRIGADVSKGVVDEYGRIFSKDGDVHKGLYVADGSIIPTSLGLNPSLTIAALSLRIADKVIAEL